MAKKYNPWTGFLEDTVTKANDASPVVGKKYTIMGKEFKVLEVKGDNVKVLGSDGIGSHLNIKMFDEKPRIDKAIRNCDAGEVDILFYVDIDGNKVHETFSSNSAMNSRLNELKKHGIKRFKTWSHAEWTKSESEFRKLFNQIKGSL